MADGAGRRARDGTDPGRSGRASPEELGRPGGGACGQGLAEPGYADLARRLLAVEDALARVRRSRSVLMDVLAGMDRIYRSRVSELEAENRRLRRALQHLRRRVVAGGRTEGVGASPF